MNEETKKFISKNKETIEDFNKFIEENRKDIASIIVGVDFFFYFKEMDGFEDYQNHQGKYKKIRIIGDAYVPPSTVRFLLRSAPKFQFNAPCVCGIYKDEPHP